MNNSNALQYGRPDDNDPRKKRAKPEERKKGSKKNPKDSASKPNKNIEVSKETEDKIRKLMEEHNKKDPKFRANMAQLKSVFRRGAGAFSTSHAPGMDRTRWGLNRIKAFLYLLRNGRPSNPNYKQDNDLLPEGHPRSTKKARSGYLYELVDFSEVLKSVKESLDMAESENNINKKKRPEVKEHIQNYFTDAAESYDAPQSARNNAKKVLEWKDKYGKECKGMTPVGWARARDLARGAMLSADTVKRMAQFNRHRSNYEKAKSKPEYKTKPWTIPAVVAWLGWGGTTGVDWAIRTSESIRNKKR
jgi:hypothetical protein